MEWSDEAIVLGARRHGESGLILETMTRGHGRHLGLVRGGAGPRLRPTLQPGNTLQVGWRARLEDHLGTFTVETQVSRAATVLESALGLHCVSLLACHLRLLAEREAHESLYHACAIILDGFDNPLASAMQMVRFEMALLEELGFGMDLSQCASTGSTLNLTHVSPKSARAVSGEAALPYLDRLLPLPGFLRKDRPDRAIDEHDITAGFRLTGYFLTRHVYEVRAIPEPDCRRAFFHAAMRRVAMPALAADVLQG